MPRLARKDLNTPFLHVMVQGVNKEYIFYSKEYIKEYLKIIERNIHKYNFTIMAYCVMSNHAHFLMYVEDIDELGNFMHRVNLLYAQLYNESENRCGVLFRNRYQTEPIYDEKHLINCIKYIHDNPVKAKMVYKCDEYEFSSYNEYVCNGPITKSEIMKKVFGNECDFNELFKSMYEKRFMDVENNNENSEKYILEGIGEFCKVHSYSLVEIFSNREVLKQLINYLNENCMLRFVEIQRYLGVSKMTLNNLRRA